MISDAWDAFVYLIMTHLDLFLQKGPANGDPVAGLEELRRVVLLDGIPSNSDGMVRMNSVLRGLQC